ncbi:hypothetical protein AADZ91_05665 [Colwelliaceae bacterium 6441]
MHGQRLTLDYAGSLTGISWGGSLGYLNEGISSNQKPSDPTAQFKACQKVLDKKPANCSNNTNIDPNGCSSYGLGGSYNAIIYSACNAHDTCYTSVGATKGSCDTLFAGDLSNKCTSIGDIVKKLECHSLSILAINIVVNVDSSRFFEPAQAALKCVIWKNLRKKYVSVNCF